MPELSGLILLRFALFIASLKNGHSVSRFTRGYLEMKGRLSNGKL